MMDDTGFRWLLREGWMSVRASRKRRSTPSPRYAAAADLLRVLCVFMVAWFHIWQQSWLSPVLRVGGFTLNLTAQVRAGYMFVDLMLLLSGFLCYLPYARGKEYGTGEFYARRALRILPSYWFCLAVMLAMALLAPGFCDPGRLMKDLLLHLGFAHNLFPESYTMTRLNVVLWTLAVEVQFYLLLPALAPVFRKHPLITWLAMTLTAFCFRYRWTMFYTDTTLYINRLPNMLDLYATGMLAAHFYPRLAKIRRRRALVATLATVAMVAGLWGIWHIVAVQAWVSGYEALHNGQLTRRFPLAVCGGLFLLGGSLSFRPVRALCSNPPVRWLSGISYNYFIWHQWLAVQFKKWRIPPYLAEADPNQVGEQPWQLRYTLLCFAAALLVAVAVTYLIERPCARLGRRWLEAEKTDGAVPGETTPPADG